MLLPFRHTELPGQEVQSSFGEIELEAVSVESVDAKNQINAQTKVIKVSDSSIKFSQREPSNMKSGETYLWHLHHR
jgi:hypothetical protein